MPQAVGVALPPSPAAVRARLAVPDVWAAELSGPAMWLEYMAIDGVWARGRFFAASGRRRSSRLWARS